MQHQTNSHGTTHKIFSYRIKIWLSFVATTSNKSCKVPNCFVKQSFKCDSSLFFHVYFQTIFWMFVLIYTLVLLSVISILLDNSFVKKTQIFHKLRKSHNAKSLYDVDITSSSTCCQFSLILQFPCIPFRLCFLFFSNFNFLL